MKNDTSAPTTFERFYIMCLELTFRQDQSIDAWAEVARGIATKLAEAAGVGVPALPVEGQPQAATIPDGVSGSPFGPAFAGWDTTALQKILFAVQQIVIGREMNASEEQIQDVTTALGEAIDELEAAHRKLSK